MGSPLNESCRSWGPHHSETLHTVTFSSAVELAATEVTQGAFLALMGYNPSQHAACGSDKTRLDNVLSENRAARRTQRTAQRDVARTPHDFGQQ